MVVSAAAGAVGSIAGQLLHERGAHVVGIAGGAEKCEYVIDQLGFDACVDRRSPDWREQLDAATPNGIDGDVEHAGGAILDHVLGRLNVGARIALSGMIADYSASAEQRYGLRNLLQVIQQRATLTGLLVLDHVERFPEITEQLAQRLADGRLQHRSTVVDGLENAEAALEAIMHGRNTGKTLVRVSS